MRKIIFILLMIACGKISLAQCDKKSVFTSSHTEYLHANGKLQRTKDEKWVVEISKSEVIVTPENDERKMTGTIKSDSCDWKTPFKVGKSIIKATFTREGESPMNATVTIEGKDGK